jgi:hypothetical protein
VRAFENMELRETFGEYVKGNRRIKNIQQGAP